MVDTTPIESKGYGPGDQTRLVVAASYTDPITGMVYVHKDLEPALAPWQAEAHIPLAQVNEQFGDVPSWVDFVKRFVPAPADDYPPFLTWNARGLHAILDFHEAIGTPDRCRWRATCPFVHSPEWRAWTRLASGIALKQRELVEQLEDLAEDIREPSAADLMTVLRSLRANVQATATTELRPDGTTSVAWSQDKTLTGGRAGELTLPAVLTIAVPVLKGDPQPYQLLVRLRATIDDSAHLAFRLSLVNAERVLEAVYADRVEQATAALGEGYQLLRGAD